MDFQIITISQELQREGFTMVYCGNVSSEDSRKLKAGYIPEGQLEQALADFLKGGTVQVIELGTGDTGAG